MHGLMTCSSRRTRRSLLMRSRPDWIGFARPPNGLDDRPSLHADLSNFIAMQRFRKLKTLLLGCSSTAVASLRARPHLPSSMPIQHPARAACTTSRFNVLQVGHRERARAGAFQVAHERHRAVTSTSSQPPTARDPHQRQAKLRSFRPLRPRVRTAPPPCPNCDQSSRPL